LTAAERSEAGRAAVLKPIGIQGFNINDEARLQALLRWLGDSGSSAAGPGASICSKYASRISRRAPPARRRAGSPT
jgi:hypothetical protein